MARKLKFVSVLLTVIIAFPVLARVYPGGKEHVYPDVVIHSFNEGRAEIVDGQTPAFKTIFYWAEQHPEGRIELQGKYSSPPNYKNNNLENQKNLALWRAWSVKDALVAHKVKNPDRIVIYNPSRGTTGNQKLDQCVDVYFVEQPMVQVSKVEFNEQIDCPTGYTGVVVSKEWKQSGDVVYVDIQTKCEPDNPVTSLENQAIIDGDTTNNTQSTDYQNTSNPLLDTRYWGYTISGTVIGCAGGYLLSSVEGGKGGGSGQNKGGDAGQICQDDATCIISGCVIGWGTSQILYYVDQSVRETKKP